jgi:BASS family bile acid:Na+ symporter
LTALGRRLPYTFLEAGFLFPAIMVVVGWFMAVDGRKTRSATSLIEPGSNAGPVFAAVAIGFNNDPEILGTVTALIFLQIIVSVFAASYLGRGQPAPDEAPDEGQPEEEPAEAQPAEAQPAQ